MKDNNNKNTKKQKPIEIGGPKGLEPTRYGGIKSPEWEINGRVSDF